MQTVLTSVYNSRESLRPSLPTPDILTPPNGTFRSLTSQQLTQTVPTFKAELQERVQILLHASRAWEPLIHCTDWHSQLSVSANVSVTHHIINGVSLISAHTPLEKQTNLKAIIAQPMEFICSSLLPKIYLAELDSGCKCVCITWHFLHACTCTKLSSELGYSTPMQLWHVS